MFTLRLLIALYICAADQITKLLIIQNFADSGMVHILPFLNYGYARNPGAAFGFLASSPGWQRWFFVAIAIVISSVVIAWIKRLPAKAHWEGMALACILGGALGNMIDRIFRGSVVDFIDFHIGTWHWYTFNVADIAICVGAILLIALSWINPVHLADQR